MIHFVVHAFPFLIDLAISSKIFRLVSKLIQVQSKLINADDRILVKVGDFFPSPISDMGLQKASE